MCSLKEIRKEVLHQMASSRHAHAHPRIHGYDGKIFTSTYQAAPSWIRQSAPYALDSAQRIRLTKAETKCSLTSHGRYTMD